MTSGIDGDTSSWESAFELAALGPIESITLSADGSTTIVVFGQSFVSDNSSIELAVGDYAFAASISNGSLDVLVPVDEEYLYGVSEVGVVGSIASVSDELGQFTIGSTTFDFSNLLSESPDFSPEVGDVIEVAGNQQVPGGTVILGIHGSGARGIHGSGARGIHGSGARGIHGSGARGIHGSGAR